MLDVNGSKVVPVDEWLWCAFEDDEARWDVGLVIALVIFESDVRPMVLRPGQVPPTIVTVSGGRWHIFDNIHEARSRVNHEYRR